MSIAPGRHPLVSLARSPENPFLQEWALLSLAYRLLENAPDLPATGYQVLLKSADWEAWENGRMLERSKGVPSLEITLRPGRVDARWHVPEFVPDDQQWKYQLGQLLRFALTGQPDFAERTQLVDRPRRLPRYIGVRSHWFRRRYGHFNGQTDFGPAWVPLSDWSTHLLGRLLEWPGYTRHGLEMSPVIPEGLTAGILRRVLRRRLEALRGDYCGASGMPAYRVRVNWEDLGREANGTGRDGRILRVAVVQTALPSPQMFDRAQADPTLSKRAILSELANHFTASLTALEKMFEVRATHTGGSYKPDLIIFPELALHPRHFWTHLKRFVQQWRTMVFIGAIYHSRSAGEDRLINTGYWILPFTTAASGPTLRVVEQGKKHLAPQEKVFGAKVRNNGAGDITGWRPCQWLVEIAPAGVGEVIFLLSAAICYDATDLRLATDLRELQTDAFVVSALNQDVTTFESMVTAMNYHMFQPVILANNGSFGGSHAQWPIAEPRHERILFQSHGANQVTVNFLELDMPLIRRRLRVNTQITYRFKSPPAGLPG